MKKVLVITAIITLLLAGFVSCNGAVDERLWGSKEPALETVTVTFVSNGGTEVASQTIVKGTCAVKPQDPAFGTHLFEGWFLKDSEELFDFSTPINQNITLYAHWDKETVFLSKTLSNVAKNERQEVSIAASPANITGQGDDSVTTISFPAGSFGDTEETVTEEINVIVYQTPVAAAKFTVSSQSAVAGLDLTVTVNDVPVTTFNNQVVKVTTYIAKNLTNVGIHYEDETWTSTTDVTAAGQFSYESSTGKLVFGTNHFSQFLLSANEVAYVESNQTAYLDLSDAITSATDVDTVSLLKDTTENTAAGTINYFSLSAQAPETAILIDKNITIKGFNHKLKTTLAVALGITSSNISVNVIDLNIEAKTSAIQLTENIDNVEINIEGSELSVTSNGYAFRTGNGTKDLTVTMKNTKVAGYSAFTLRNSNSTFKIVDCDLRGKNEASSAPSNDYAAIVFDGAAYAGHYTSTSPYQNTPGICGSNNTMEIINTSLRATSETDNSQVWLNMQYGARNNTVIVDALSVISPDDVWHYTEDDGKTTNTIKINGEAISGVEGDA